VAEYAFLEFVRNWPDVVVAANRYEVELRTTGRPDAADMLLMAYGRLRDDLQELARRMAIAGTEELRKMERATRVRPDTMGQGGPRLEDSLFAEVLPIQDIMPGSIGIANEDVLDGSVPWWITNEIGSTARVGGVLYGFFYDGDVAPPDSSEFRVHPLFQPGYSPVSGTGIIKNPIPARKFIEKAVAIIDREWHIGYAGATVRFENALARITATRT
jgi:hypothetical protein